MCLEGGTSASLWFGEEGGVQPILTLCPHQLPLRGNSSTTSHCPDVPSVHHYTPLPLFSWSRLHFFQFALANTFCQTTKAQGLLSILLGGHSKFLAFSHFAKVPMALHSHPRLWLLCSSNTLLDVAILWEPLSSLGHSERRLWHPWWCANFNDCDYNRKQSSHHCKGLAHSTSETMASWNKT